MPSSDYNEVQSVIDSWIEHGEFLIENSTLYGAEAIANWIVALEEDGDYDDLVRQAKAHFKDVFGEW